MIQARHEIQDTDSSFEAMAAGTKRKYFMISGKGGVGKTSLAASLACKFAAAGHTTLVVSTDPAHSLSDSLDQVIVLMTQLSCNLSQHSLMFCKPAEYAISLEMLFGASDAETTFALCPPPSALFG